MDYPASRNLDAEIAKKVLKIFVIIDDAGEYQVVSPRTKNRGLLPYYSTRTEDAHMLIEALQYKGYYCKLGSIQVDGDTIYRCGFSTLSDNGYTAESNTMPHAVALAALQLVK